MWVHGLAGGEAVHAADEELHDASDDGEAEEDDEKLGQTVLDHQDDVVVPACAEGVPKAGGKGLFDIGDAALDGVGE